MRLPRFSSLALLLALLTLSSGCQTSIGNYLGNRARDFSECFLLKGGIALGLDVDVKAAGLAHFNLGFASYDPVLSLGLYYGRLRPALGEDGADEELEAGLPILSLLSDGMLHHAMVPRLPTDAAGNIGGLGHACLWMCPALLSWVDWSMPLEFSEGTDTRWLWSDEPVTTWPGYSRYIRWNRIHAFDIEVGVVALIVGARAGFSPGEFLDFLLGWFGVDIAGDDLGLAKAHPPHPEEEGQQGETGE